MYLAVLVAKEETKASPCLQEEDEEHLWYKENLGDLELSGK